MSEDLHRLDASTQAGPPSGVSPAPPQGLIGTVIDRRYRVEALLGEGGMGLVYRVRHTELNKSLAIKVLRRENTRDPEVVARFRREAESASGIGHQHIVDINDFGVLNDGSTYFVMECLEGMDLIDAMDRAQRIDEGRALHIAEQVCRALGAAHEAGIIHRDLKPENIFLTYRNGVDDFVKVLDFGIAKVANGPKRLTRQGEVLGTPHYMSPEQCEGENVDHRTDIYALGVLLYEMVTGHVPHDADNMAGILTKHMYEEPIPPRVRAPHISTALEEVIQRCLEKKPERRYQTMRELEADLARVREGSSPRGPNTVTLTPTRPPASPRARRRRSLLLGLAAAVLVFAAAVGISWSMGRSRPHIESDTVPTAKTEVAAPVEALTETEAPRDDKDAEAVGAAHAPTPQNAAPADRKTARRKPAKREPKPRPTRAREGTTVILDPWK